MSSSILRNCCRFPSNFLLGFSCLIIAIESGQNPAIAQQINSATIVEVLDSNQVYIQGEQAQQNDVAELGQQVSTGQARAGLQFNNNAAIRLGQNSSLVVGSKCVQVKRGRVIISGSARGCVGSIIAVTRGTIYALEAQETDNGLVYICKVLQGEVAVSKTDDDTSKPIFLKERQKISATPLGGFGAIEELSQEEFEELLGGSLFKDFKIAIPNIEKLPSAAQANNSQGGFSETFLSDALGANRDPLGSSGESAIKTSTTSAEIQLPNTVVNSSNNGTITVTNFGGSIANATFQPGSGTSVVPFAFSVTRTPTSTTINLFPGAITIGTTTISVAGLNSALINGVLAKDVSFGLSGNDAVVTVTGNDGLTFRARAVGVNGKAPNAGDSFPGIISIELPPDR